MTRSTLVWSALVILVAMGVARAMFPAYTDEIPLLEKRFSDTPTLTLLHVIPGALFLILGLLQFSPRIRERHLGFHRWSGRLDVDGSGVPVFAHREAAHGGAATSRDIASG